MKTKIGQIRSKLTPLVPNRPPGGTPFVTGRRRRAHARPSPRTERAYDAGPKEGERGPGLFAPSGANYCVYYGLRRLRPRFETYFGIRTRWTCAAQRCACGFYPLIQTIPIPMSSKNEIGLTIKKPRRFVSNTFVCHTLYSPNPWS